MDQRVCVGTSHFIIVLPLDQDPVGNSELPGPDPGHFSHDRSSCRLSIPHVGTKRPCPCCLAGPMKGRYTPMNMPVSRGIFRLMPHVSQ